MNLCVLWMQEFPQVNASLRSSLSRSAALCVPNGSRLPLTDRSHINLAANLQAIGYCVNHDDNRRWGKAAELLPKTLWKGWGGARTRLSLTFPCTPHPVMDGSVSSRLCWKNNIIQFPLTCYFTFFFFLFVDGQSDIPPLPPQLMSKWQG